MNREFITQVSTRVSAAGMGYRAVIAGSARQVYTGRRKRPAETSCRWQRLLAGSWEPGWDALGRKVVRIFRRTRADLQVGCDYSGV